MALELNDNIYTKEGLEFYIPKGYHLGSVIELLKEHFDIDEVKNKNIFILNNKKKEEK